MLRKYFHRFPPAITGIIYAAANDFGFRSQLYLGALLGIIIAIVFKTLSSIEFLFLALAWALILITELQNSALESALDCLHPEQSDSIKQSKDMAAGAVLTAGIFLLIVLLMMLYHRF